MRKLSHWLEELTPAESLDVFRELAYSHAREGGDVGRQIMRLIERGDYRSLVEFELNYSDPAWSAHAVKQCRQALAFFQKLPDLHIGIDKKEVALRKFLEAEELCRQTNSILSMHRRGLLSWPSRVEAVFHSAQRKIARILGNPPSFSQLDLRFGPGATCGVKRSEASNRRKLAEKPQCSEDFLPIAAMVLGEMPHLASVHGSPDSERTEMTSVGDDVCVRFYDFLGLETEHLLDLIDRKVLPAPAVKRGIVVDEMVSVPVEIVPARLNFVPKSAKTYRSVCVEAGLNVTFQLALGTFMAKRLAAFGIDIRDQSLNQRRALEGSLTGALATLDLSSASDTISRELVFELLPLEWAELLNWGRSSTVELPSGETMTQEKFASMGNGFTFPLETLIFWSLAAACCDCDSDATVYGDDIVLPSDRFELLSEVLHYAGFLVNAGKSFHKGPFRESCGKDYFRGIDVRPFYAKGWVNAQLLFVLHNFYVRDRDSQRAKVVEDLIHPDLKLWGPEGYGDGHLIGEHPKSRPDKYHSRGFGGYFFNTFTTKQRKDIVPNAAGDFVLPLYSIYRRSGGEDLEIVSRDDQSFQIVNLEDGSSTTHHWDELKSVSQLVRDAKHRLVQCAPLPLPEKERVKALTLPGVDGYKKITIYTLGS